MKKLFKDLFIDSIAIIIGGIMYAAGLCIFIAPHGMLTGGASGIGIVINRFTGVPTGTLIFLINIPLFIAAFFICGKKYTLRTVYCCFLFSAVIDIFEIFVNYTYAGEKVVCALYGGILMGAGLFVILIRSIVTGGSDLLAYLIQRKYPAWSISTLVLVIDAIIVIAGAIVYKSADSALYSIILVIVLTLVLDTLLRGRTSGHVYFILSEKADEIREKIMSELERGVTSIDVKGGYTGKEKQMIMCAVGKRQAGFLKRLVFSVDPSAFVISAGAEGVYGDGFINLKKEDVF